MNRTARIVGCRLEISAGWIPHNNRVVPGAPIMLTGQNLETDPEIEERIPAQGTLRARRRRKELYHRKVLGVG